MDSESGERSQADLDPQHLVVVEITVLPDPGARSLAGRIAGIKRLATSRVTVIVAVLVAVLGAGATAWLVTAGSRRPLVNPLAREDSPAGVAAAYGYPLRCLTVTIVPAHGTYARADFDHATPCGRFTGDVTAIFRYTSGAWRAILDSAEYICPVRAMPADVQAKLGVCGMS